VKLFLLQNSKELASITLILARQEGKGEDKREGTSESLPTLTVNYRGLL